MKSFSKIVTTVALLASFSAFAGADMVVSDDALAASTDLTAATAIELVTGQDGGYAAIVQTTDAASAFIAQTGVNQAFIGQNIEASAAIIQTGAGNKAVIIQGE